MDFEKSQLSRDNHTVAIWDDNTVAMRDDHTVAMWDDHTVATQAEVLCQLMLCCKPVHSGTSNPFPRFRLPSMPQEMPNFPGQFSGYMTKICSPALLSQQDGPGHTSQKTVHVLLKN